MDDSDSPDTGGSWAQRHLRSLAWAGVGVLVGLIAGFVAGGYFACAPSKTCEFKADLAGALGTWVGGLGTIGALVFAVVAFRSEEAARRRDEAAKIEFEASRRVEAAAARAAAERERQLEEDALHREIERGQRLADAVIIVVEIGSTTGDQVRGVIVSVKNSNEAATITDLGGRVEGLGAIDLKEILGPSQTHWQRFNALEVRNWPAMTVPSPESKDEWNREKAARVTISFEVHGRRWIRRGHEPAELVDDL